MDTALATGDISAIVVTVEFVQRSGNFKLSGQERLNLPSATAHIALTYEAIVAIVKLYNTNVFDHMRDNNIVQQKVAVPHVAGTATAPPPPVPEAPSPEPADQEPEDPEPAVQGPAPTRRAGSSMWHTYLRMIKLTNPHLTHAQARSLASLSYREWRATQ
jgi:hypothetical protein